MNKTLLREFANPPSCYRGKPFWAWNGTLEPEQLRKQIRMMKRMGLGGFFMHSRVGLDTRYLSKEWFECVEACVDEARVQKMEAWLYDEDRWPSGAAGGLVTRNPRFRMRSLHMDQLTSATGLWTGDTIAVYVATVTDNSASAIRRLRQRETPRLAKGESILRFRVEVEKGNPWYNDQTYLDTLNPEAVREFIRVTHDAYQKHQGHEFGKTVPGIFTDEPNYGHLFGGGGDQPIRTPWTGALPAVFRRRYGYAITEHLPELFLDTDSPRATQIRYHYMDCITHLFVTSYSKQIGEWCAKHNIQFTGHMLAEETLASQTTHVGSAMRHYEFMQAPGMDLLTQSNREYDTAKQVSSMAHQFGAKWRLTETYGCTGWDFPFEGHKALGDWQAALGINLRCQHLAWYTMLAEAKRDYPAAIFYQSPWWDLYPIIEDYFGRIGAVMTRGAEVRDILVVHPIESMWLHVGTGWQSKPQSAALNRMLVDLRATLLAANLDFDYGDEDVMSRHARVRTVGDGAELVIGKASYRTVVVPPMHTIRSSTLELLDRFARAGGHVVQAGEPAPMVDAIASKAPRAFASSCARAPVSGERLASTVAGFGRRISITDPSGAQIVPTLYQLCADRDNYYLFVCNTSEDYRKVNPKWVVGSPRVEKRTDAFPQVTISGFGDCEGAPIEMDPFDGRIYQADARKVAGTWHISSSLARLGSRLFVVPRAKSADRYPRRAHPRNLRARTVNPSRWEATLSEHNVLVLDRPHYRIDGGREEPQKEILKVDQKVRDALGVRHRGGAMVQPWAREVATDARSARVALRYTFSVKQIPTGELLLGLEQPGRYTVALNGTPVDTSVPTGWWTDQSLQTLRLDASVLKHGVNHLTLECDYREDHPGFEIVYLLGSFGVQVNDTALTLVSQPATVRLGDWVTQGLPFFAGHVTYSTTLRGLAARRGERLIVEIPSFSGAAVRVLVDGKSAGVAGWPPYELDITDLVDGDSTRLSIEILGHRRNSHGPLHLKNKTPGWTGPGEFVRDDDWTEGYSLVRCGLLEAPRMVTRRA